MRKLQKKREKTQYEKPVARTLKGEISNNKKKKKFFEE